MHEINTIDDKNQEKSLQENGLIISNYKSDCYLCAYKHDETYEIGFASESEIEDFLNGKSWAPKKQIKKFINNFLDIDERSFYNLPFIYKLYFIMQYFGVKHIMGPKIFEMSLTEALRDFNFKLQ